MSLVKAVRLVENHLPRDLATSVAEALTEGVSQSELSIERFAFWKVASLDGQKFICERKQISADDAVKKEWYTRQIQFLSATSQSSTKEDLWQGYFVDGEKRTGTFWPMQDEESFVAVPIRKSCVNVSTGQIVFLTASEIIEG